MKRMMIVLSVLLLIAAAPLRASATTAFYVLVSQGRYLAGSPDGSFVIEQGMDLRLANGETSGRHSITSVTRGLDGSVLFDTGEVPPRAIARASGIERLDPGTYLFRCSVVDGMGGSVLVLDRRTPAPPPVRPIEGPERPTLPSVPSVPDPWGFQVCTPVICVRVGWCYGPTPLCIW